MMPEVPGKNNVCAVVVTCNPSEGFPRRLEALRRQAAAAVAVDNGSHAEFKAELAAAAERLGAHVIFNDDNLGIAAALNRGVQWAADQGYQWALTMDDDTTVGEHMIEDLAATYRQCPFRESVGMMAANFFEPIAGRSFYPAYGRRPWLEVITAISSGSMLPVSVWREVGPFREDFFLDHVDNEYCLRLRRRGYRVIVSQRPGMSHVLGWEKSLVNRYSVRISTGNYTPVRRYYIARNRLVVAAEYHETEGVWVFNDMIRALLEAAAMLLLERDKLAKLRATLLGAWHAAVGRLGPAPERLGRPRP